MNFGQERLFKNIQSGGHVSLADHTLLSMDSGVVDTRGLTALSLAIDKNNRHAFDVLMRLPPDKIDDYLHKADNQGRFPVEIAAKSSDPIFLNKILSHDASLVNQQNNKTGCVIMHMLIRNERMGLGGDAQQELINIVKGYNPDMTIRNKQGETPEEAVLRLTGISSTIEKTM